MQHAIFLDLVFYQPEPCNNNNQEVKIKRAIHNHYEIENPNKFRTCHMNANDFVLQCNIIELSYIS
jgi:hypothetical protein